MTVCFSNMCYCLHLNFHVPLCFLGMIYTPVLLCILYLRMLSVVNRTYTANKQTQTVANINASFSNYYYYT